MQLDKEKKPQIHWMLILATVTGSLIKLTAGIMSVWSSPSTPKLNGFTTDQIFMVTVMFNIGQVIAIPLVALTVDRVGRKRGVLWCTVPILVSWGGMVVSQSYEVLCCCRLLGGIGCGYGKTIISMYATEISQTNYRGGLGTLTSLMTRFGMLFIFSIGPFVEISTMALIASIFPIIMFTTFIWMPESPYFLLLQGNPEKAKQSLSRIRGDNCDQEFLQIEKSVSIRKSSFEVLQKIVGSEVHRRGIWIVFVINTIEQFSGMSVILTYSEYIFKLSGSSVSPAVASIITITIQTMSLAVITPIIDRFNRRKLMVISCLGTGISMAFLSGYFGFSKEGSVSLIPLIALVLYHVWSVIGISTLPTVFQNEVFSVEVKAMAISVCAMYTQLLTVIVNQIFTIFSRFCLTWAIFGFFSFCCFVSVILSVTVVPETRGLSLEDVQVLMKSKCKKVDEKKIPIFVISDKLDPGAKV